MAVYGYLRVSSISQHKEDGYQEKEIINYVKKHNLGSIEFIDDVVSGAKDWKKRKIGEIVINKMKENDILLINEFSRLARSLLDILDILKTLKEKNCQIHIVRDNMIVGDDINSKLFVFAMGLVGEIERDLIKSRVKEGIKNSRTNNPQKSWGRPKGSQYKSKLDNQKENIIDLLAKNVSKTSIARILNINYQTLCSYIKTRKLAT